MSLSKECTLTLNVLTNFHQILHAATAMYAKQRDIKLIHFTQHVYTHYLVNSHYTVTMCDTKLLTEIM